MASDFEKPNKIHTLYPKEIQDKMWPLPVGELFMLGRKSVPKLYNMHIKTIGDLAKANINELTNKFGKHGKMMWEYANGIDESEVIYNYGPPKSIGNSTTLAKDVSNVETLNEILLTLAEHVAYRLRKYKMVANVVNVGLRTKDFKDFSDTAAALKAMDVVVTVDTSIAHLAGALGVKTFLLLPYAADWRWFKDTKTTPWYDSVEIFKQQDCISWEKEIDEIIARLKNLLDEKYF